MSDRLAKVRDIFGDDIECEPGAPSLRSLAGVINRRSRRDPLDERWAVDADGNACLTIDGLASVRIEDLRYKRCRFGMTIEMGGRQVMRFHDTVVDAQHAAEEALTILGGLAL